MLDWLRARNVALLREVSLEFGEGLQVLTGETGVGKSVLLESFGLALGGRARGQLIGAAGDRALIEAGFSLGDLSASEERALEQTLAPLGADLGDGELIIRRELRSGASGRSLLNRTTINGAAASVGSLRAVGRLLAEVYSQGEHLALLRPGAARETVDEVGGHEEIVEGTRAAFGELREAERRLEALEARRRRAGSERAEMERAVAEIGEAAPEPGEREALAGERRALRDADHLLEQLDTAWEALYGSEQSAGVLLGVAGRALSDAARRDPATAALLEGRSDPLAEVEDLAAAVRARREAVRAAPERLAQIEERLALLGRLERRYDRAAEDLAEYARECREALGALSDEAEAGKRTRAEVEERRAAYLDCARKLSRARKAAAAALGRSVESELAGLGIPRARLSIAVEDAAPPGTAEEDAEGSARFSEHGLDRVEFRFSASPDLPPAPIAEVASGGEASRFFLALKAASAGRGGARTLVFDEADSGTSGRIADAVGRRLLRLAHGRQVISVTHLPQVAALGHSHLLVEKLESAESVRVRRVSGADRTEEIARMLAGPVVTESARRHAEQLLAGAGESPAPRPAPNPVAAG